MADKSHIEWTDATWNPITGCSVVSPGCTNCYAMRFAGTRGKHMPSRAGLTNMTRTGPVWNGQVRFNGEWLYQPLRWRRPRLIFVCAHGDLFHENVPDAWIDRIFAVMALAPQHTFQPLTKRSARLRAYLTGDGVNHRIANTISDYFLNDEPKFLDWPIEVDDATAPNFLPKLRAWPLPNVWVGVSVEDQQRANERIPDLLATPAAIRWVSAEPLLGPIDFTRIDIDGDYEINALRPGSEADVWRESWSPEATGMPLADCIADFVESGASYPPTEHQQPGLDWIEAGGESAQNKPGRPMHPDWVRALRDQCQAAQVAFGFKQWGDWVHDPRVGEAQGCFIGDRFTTEIPWNPGGHPEGCICMARVGKARAGRLLDGRVWDEMPGVISC